MPLIGIIAKKREIQAVKKELQNNNIEIIEINKESVSNLKNIVFEEIIISEDINFEKEEYKYMNEIISKAKYLIINADIEIKMLKKVNIEKPIKVITFGFNTKATISVSSVKEEKIIVGIQRDIQKTDGTTLEVQEKEISKEKNQKIYNKLIVFLIKDLHNIYKNQ